MADSIATRTPLFMRRTPGGVFTLVDIEENPRNVFFVDSGAAGKGATSGFGRNPDAPFSTLAAAFSTDVLSAGDVVYCMPGHAENLAAADAIDCDIAGVSVIGVGWGNLQPQFSATAAAGEIEIGAANIKLHNLRFTCNFTGGGTSAIDVAAAGDGFELSHCRFDDTAATKEWLIHVSIATTVTDFRIHHNRMVGLIGGDMTNSILAAGATTNGRIDHNFIDVDSSDDVIDFLTTAGTGLQVDHNTIINEDAAVAGYCFRAHASTTGVVHDNRFGYNKVNAEMGSAAAMFWFENYASNTIAQSGLLDPATTHAIP